MASSSSDNQIRISYINYYLNLNAYGTAIGTLIAERVVLIYFSMDTIAGILYIGFDSPLFMVFRIFQDLI